MWTYNSELYHHGVMGQKWGVRRYQNRDGSLTSKGRKRRDSSSTSETSTKKKQTEKETAPARKKASEMSDDELRAAINRKRLEKDYNTLYPAKVSAGKKFATTLKDKVIVPAVTEAGKTILKDYLQQQGKTMLKISTGDQPKPKPKNQE